MSDMPGVPVRPQHGPPVGEHTGRTLALEADSAVAATNEVPLQPPQLSLFTLGAPLLSLLCPLHAVAVALHMTCTTIAAVGKHHSGAAYSYAPDVVSNNVEHTFCSLALPSSQTLYAGVLLPFCERYPKPSLHACFVFMHALMVQVPPQQRSSSAPCV